MITRIARIPLVALSLAALATGCVDDEAPYSPESVDRAVLVHFASCEDLLDYARYQAMEQVGPYGFEGEYGWGGLEGEDGGGIDVPAGGDEGGDTAGGDPNGDVPDYSGTNVQELGVDEPDIVKTDGTRIIALAQGKLHYVDVSAEGGPAKVSELAILAAEDDYYWYEGSEMLLHGDRVLVMVRRNGWELPAHVRDAFGIGEDEYRSVVELVEVDVSNPAAMRRVSSLYVEGSYVSGRLHDDVARVVLTTQVESLPFKYPWDFLDENDIVVDEWSGGWDEIAYARAEAEAEAYNRRLVRDTELGDWVPAYVLEQHDSGDLQTGTLVECQRMMRPGTFSGLSTLSVLTIDMGQVLGLGDAVGLFSEGETVYASASNLYVATRPFMKEGEEAAFGEDPEFHFSSYVHKFDISSDDAAYYQASGEVPGYLLSQWAMSELDGDLRVASTEWGWSDLSESYVTVLRQDGESLEVVGQVGGLGRGEQIYAVRFIDDTGYVVTFRQIDPLYTVDLRDPTAPAVVGELKIEGYSAYLHPVGEDLLLGIGRDGTSEGQVLGTQVSLFDVSDPANPRALYQESFGEWSSSEVEFDHHAFLWWGPQNLAVLPVTSWGFDEETGNEEYFSGALAYRIDPESGISLVGTIEHSPEGAEDWWYGNDIRRSMVIGEDLFTMSADGILRSNLGDLAADGWVAF
ncbi:MAG: beta-propeller domain-containing protein [Myxococcales bacterium]|nr:beta-propeller domain-containing protein [Myxococcales bacterium]MCB9718269.1 beta-propeller domain-containing protein [Myxococcales bacterium]